MHQPKYEKDWIPKEKKKKKGNEKEKGKVGNV